MDIIYYLMVSLFACEMIMHYTSAQDAECRNVPTIPVNGNITYTPTLQTSHTHGTRAEYICDAGYTNTGPQIVIYCHNGQWLGLENDDPTKCLEESTDIANRDCQSPEVDGLRENLIQTGSYRPMEGKALRFACVPGYCMHPPLILPVSNCINGGWTVEAPHCIQEEDSCPDAGSSSTSKPKEASTTSKPKEASSTSKPEEAIKTTEVDMPKGEEPPSGTSAGVIVGVVVPIIVLLLLVIAFIGFRFYISQNEEKPQTPPPVEIDTSWQPAPPRVIDPHDFPYSTPNTVLTRNDVTFGLLVDYFDNTYNVTIRPERNRQQDAVARVIEGNFSMEDKEAMEREIDAVFRLPLHYAVIRPIAEIGDDDLIGICTEKSPKGSLWSYLHSFRDARNSVKPKSRELISYALQIAEGMKFLHEEERVCPMLSCRQIMMFRDNVCKVPILGLKRINDNTDLYRFSENTQLPVRWMAPEAINYHIFTKKSDIWAFGVVLYELVALGNTPYENIASEKLAELLSNGHRLEKPDFCGDTLFAIMQRCWQQDPKDRPSFEELLEQLRELKHNDNAISFGPDYIEHPSSLNPFSSHEY